MTDLTATVRSRIKRLRERGAYDFETIGSILDAGLLCHVGYVGGCRAGAHRDATPVA